MTTTNVRSGSTYGKRPLQMELEVAGSKSGVPLPAAHATPVEYAETLGKFYLAYAKSSAINRSATKQVGHYRTPSEVAHFMAQRDPYSKREMRVLDPGSGTGILSAAVCEAALSGGAVQRLHIDAYETDWFLVGLTELVLAHARRWLAHRGLAMTFSVNPNDFVLDHVDALEALNTEERNNHVNDKFRLDYDLVISNPPYFKIRKDDPRAIAGAAVVHGQPNIYALFMAVAAELLSTSGQLVFIVPRSFASGLYFRKFREHFFQRVTPTDIHLFDSRRDVFRDQAVLQENLVLTARRRIQHEFAVDDDVILSHSKAAHDLHHRHRFSVKLASILDLEGNNRELSIPRSKDDLQLVRTMRRWPNTLSSLGLEVSTGPVVPFRATQFLSRTKSELPAVPLLWMQHVRPMQTSWPLTAAEKPQWLQTEPGSNHLLLEDANYVLLRRFSAKEERRRLVASPLIRGSLNAQAIGLENHLNYVWGIERELDADLTYGLSALLNSMFYDRFFRVSNSNTQVSATELRAMPLPAERAIRTIGVEARRRCSANGRLSDLDLLVAETLDLPLALVTALETGRDE